MHLYSFELEQDNIEDIARNMGIVIHGFEYKPVSTRGIFAGRTHMKFLLRPVYGSDTYRATGYGNGKRLWAIDWEGHRDFMREVYKLDENAIIDSALARYRNADEFERLHVLTGSDINRGFRAKVMA